MKFQVGEHVAKVTGDYRAKGKVVAAFYIFPENGSVERYVVRHPAEEGFFCHIYNPDQLVSIDRTVAAKPASIDDMWRDMHVPDTLTQGELKKNPVARQYGFTGDICPQCNGPHMQRNGPCLVCHDCGHTTGCS